MNFEGLMVPVVKDVPNKSLPQLAREINDLAVRARAGKLKPDELTEGTYTITNNGAYGTVITAPIINTPQVAILSTDACARKPVVIEGPDGDSIAIRPVGVLAQSFDHRAVDGAYAAAFLRELKLIIETRHCGIAGPERHEDAQGNALRHSVDPALASTEHLDDPARAT